MTTQKSALRRRITPSVPYKLVVEDAGGVFETSFQISYDLNSMALFEEATGLNLFRDLGRILSERSVVIVTALFWAGLQINHADDYAGTEGLTIVRQNVVLSQLNEIMAACLKAFIAQLPKEKQEQLEKQRLEREQGAEVETAPLAQEAAPVATA